MPAIKVMDRSLGMVRFISMWEIATRDIARR